MPILDGSGTPVATSTKIVVSNPNQPVFGRINKVVIDVSMPGPQGPTGPTGPSGTSTAPSYAYASLPSASPAGQIARVTDRERGLWMSDGTTWNKVSPTIDLADFATGDGTTDDTAGIQAWIDAVATYHLPGFASPGIYANTGGLHTDSGQTEVHLFGPQGGWESARTAVFRNRSETITLRMDGGNSSIENVLFDGRDAGGNNAGGIGLVLGPNHKITARNIVTRNFKEAGFVADGTQNSLFENIDSFYNKINFWVTNQCRTCFFLNPNGTDSHNAINTYMDAVDPDGVELWIGRRTNSYITMTTTASTVPGDLTIMHGILERHGRHDYNVRISNGHGYVKFIDFNLQAAKTAMIRIDASVNTHAAPLRLILDNLVTENVDSAGASVPTFSNANGDTGLEIFAYQGPGFTSFNRWFETRVRESVNTEDYGNFQQTLRAPTTFGINIGAWATQGGSATVSHVNRKLRINIQSGFGGRCGPRPRWLAVASGGPFIYTANHMMKVRGHVAAMTPTDIKVSAELSASPFRRNMGTITATGSFEFTYACQGDETGVVSVNGFGGAGNGDVDFTEFAATVY